ncbi:hypothetical protein TraAM80_00857 [Trypanosoma rangeli]|uniref:Uncharacterized protein n=1 Tax=Trypanosoma rangeli TaxID=5698 RepID=A0A422P1F3_TRYRA|nr:uncharacterized protein TraAM80_00857 [Trypanosoma rangeli]RNF11529.1 hypothetical protein TraAM80_00857 [Trypanosoma rangeli]|eukprot:RNF11529.1 hypothetical protein TraAM80_00857 [Trypanosoma rangeli]
MPFTDIPIFFTDAGPYPSIAVLAAWTLVLGVSFVVFGVARPVGRGTRAPTAGEKETSFLPLWWVRQLYFCVASWPLFDMVHRMASYIFLPSRVLWRRHMLQLPDGRFGNWVNQLRLSILCLLQSKELHGTCADWQLPMASFTSSIAPYSVNEAPGATQCGIEGNGHMSNKEWEYCQWVALVSVLTTMMILFVTCGAILRLFPLQPSKHEIHEDDCSEAGTTSDDDVSSASDQELWWGLGEPDDACLLSPEAIAEEQRWKSMEVEKRLSQQRQRGHEKQKEKCGVLTLLHEYWPVFLSVCYAGLYAFTGGMPLLMRWVYPSCVMLVTVCGMIA